MFNSVCSSNDNQNNFVRSTNQIWFLLNWICLNESYRIDITFWTSKSAQDLFSSSNCFFAMYRHCDWIGAPYWDDRISFLTVGCRMPVWESRDYQIVFPGAYISLWTDPRISLPVTSHDHAYLRMRSVYIECIWISISPRVLNSQNVAKNAKFFRNFATLRSTFAESGILQI